MLQVEQLVAMERARTAEGREAALRCRVQVATHQQETIAKGNPNPNPY